MGEFVWVTAVRDAAPAEVLAAAEGAFGVPEASVAPHLVQAGPDDEDDPAMNGWGFVAFWKALGITYPDQVSVHGALQVDQAWRDLGVLDPSAP